MVAFCRTKVNVDSVHHDNFDRASDGNKQYIPTISCVIQFGQYHYFRTLFLVQNHSIQLKDSNCIH